MRSVVLGTARARRDPLSGLCRTGRQWLGNVREPQRQFHADHRPRHLQPDQGAGNARLTLNPGIYVIAGGGISVTGNASVTGTGVMIYNAGSNVLGGRRYTVLRRHHA